MALFDANIKALNEYRNDSRIRNVISSYEILTRKEFTKWFLPSIRTRGQKANKKKNALQENIHLISDLLKNICQQGIGPYYLKSTWSRVYPFREKGVTPSKSKFDKTTQFVRTDYDFDLSRDDYFDLLIAVRADVYKNQHATMEEKRKSVQTFLVSELGECAKKPNTMSVNLICSREDTSMKGFYLLAAMMCCVKASKYDQEVVLELAGKYTNIQGFKSYTRVGFDRDDQLFGDDCFKDISNLPMSVNVDPLTIDDIITYVTNKRGIQKLDDKDPLAKHFYTLPMVKKDIAYEIGSVANYMHELDLNQEPTYDSHYNMIIRDAKTKQEKKDKLFERIEGLTPRNTPVQKTRRTRRDSANKTKQLLKNAKAQMKQEQKSPSNPTNQSTKTPRIPTPPMPSLKRRAPKRRAQESLNQTQTQTQTRKKKKSRTRSTSRGRIGSADF